MNNIQHEMTQLIYALKHGGEFYDPSIAGSKELISAVKNDVPLNWTLIKSTNS